VIANLANANVTVPAENGCATNSLGGVGFQTSRTGTSSCESDGRTVAQPWCADFAIWVWANAGVGNLSGLDAGSRSFYDYGERYGTLLTSASAVPAVGDVVVFNYDSATDYADHVAIVTWMSPDGSQIDTVSGDWGSNDIQHNTVVDNGKYSSKVGSKSTKVLDGDNNPMTLSGYVAPAPATAKAPQDIALRLPWSAGTPHYVTTSYGKAALAGGLVFDLAPGSPVLSASGPATVIYAGAATGPYAPLGLMLVLDEYAGSAHYQIVYAGLGSLAHDPVLGGSTGIGDNILDSGIQIGTAGPDGLLFGVYQGIDLTNGLNGWLSNATGFLAEPLIGAGVYENFRWWSGPMTAANLGGHGAPGGLWCEPANDTQHTCSIGDTTADQSGINGKSSVVYRVFASDTVPLKQVQFTAYYAKWPSNPASPPGFDPTAIWRIVATCRPSGDSGDPPAPTNPSCTWTWVDTSGHTSAEVSYAWDPASLDSTTHPGWLPAARPARGSVCQVAQISFDVYDQAGYRNLAPNGTLAPGSCPSGSGSQAASVRPNTSLLAGAQDQSTSDGSHVVYIEPFDASADCDTSWTGATSSAWNVATNWSKGLPTTTSSVCVIGSGSTPISLASSVSIGSLFTNGQVAISAPSGLQATGDIINQGTLDLSQGSLTSGTLTNNGTLATTGTSASTISANLDNEGTLNVGAGLNLPLSGGVVTNNGSVGVSAGKTLTMTTAPTNYSSGTLTGGTWNLAGVLKFPGTGLSTNASSLTLNGSGADIVNGSTDALTALTSDKGSIDLQGGKSLTTNAPLANTGTITIEAGSTLTTTGSFSQTAGSTTLSAATSKLVASGAQVNIAGGTLSGIGTVSPALTNAATVAPGSPLGALSVAGPYTQSSTGHLAIGVAGTAASAFDQLTATGTLNLDGALDIVTSDPTLAPGDTFGFLSGSSRTGTFATVTGSKPVPGLTYTLAYGPTGASLTVGADPSAPSVILASTPSASPTNSTSFSITATFSGSVSGLDAADVTLGGTSQAATPWIVGTVSGTGTTYIFTVSCAAPADGLLTIQIAPGAVSGSSGSGNRASNTISVTIDRSGPTIGLPVLAPSSVFTGDYATVSASAGDPSNVSSAEVSVDGGSWAPMTAVDGAFGSTSEALTATITAPASAGSYQVCVRATDALGNVSAGTTCATLTVSAPQVPGAPTAVSASAGNGSALISWSAPSDNGGRSITGYTVTETEHGLGVVPCAVSGPTSCTVSGLTNGTEYIFSVHATNSVGDGPESDPSNRVTPVAPTAPGKPTNVSASPGDGSALVTWSAPADDGGASITAYTVTASDGTHTCVWTTGPLSCAVPGLTNGQSYTFKVTATNGVGEGAASNASAPVTPISAVPTPNTYHPVDPIRLLDTRSANGLSGKLSAGKPRTFQITGRGGASNIPAGATAVTANVTIVNSSAASSVYLGPSEIAHPATATINFNRNDVTAFGSTISISETGTMSATYMAASGTTDLVIDVTGYFTPDTSGDTYHPLTPARLLDTRSKNGLSGKFTANKPRTFTVRGHGGVPSNAVAVTGNLTVTDATGGWAVYLGPTPLVKPIASTINFVKGQTRANSLTVPLSSSGTLSATFLASGKSTIDLVFDVTGFYTADLTGAKYVPITTPVYILNTGSGIGSSGKIAANTPRTFTVRGSGGVPADATGITGIVSVVNQTNSWAVFVGPTPIAKPSTSSINFLRTDNCANGLTVALSGTGTLSVTYLSSSGNSANVRIVVTGYFVPSS
jgi:hypothetical protein